MRNMSIDFDSLHYLSAAANTGNFRRAAVHLGVQTSTVSRRISRLEDELGLTQFERAHFGMRLTKGGKAVMVHVRRVLTDIEAVKISARSNGSGDVGLIRVGIRMPPVGQPLQLLLETWHARYPHVDLKFYELNERDILAEMGERRLDVALMTKHTLWPNAITEALYREPILLALPKNHRLSASKSIRWTQLRHETFLVQGWDESQTTREFYSSFLGSGADYARMQQANRRC